MVTTTPAACIPQEFQHTTDKFKMSNNILVGTLVIPEASKLAGALRDVLGERVVAFFKESV